jgi:hypothetical protein
VGVNSNPPKNKRTGIDSPVQNEKKEKGKKKKMRQGKEFAVDNLSQASHP